VDAEEKKSLSSDEARSSQSRQTGFGLHYFPDIPVGGPANVRRCLSLEENFQRIQYDKIDSSCTNFVSRPDGNGTYQKKGSLSTAQLNEQAYQKGFADGKKIGMIDGENTGLELGTKKIEPLFISLQEVLEQFRNIRQEAYQRIEKEVVELALAIAKQVICREISLDREIVVCVAREALTKVDDPGKIKIKMSPSDLQFINETKYQLSNLIENIDNVTLEAEDSIQNGGCIIESDLGEIDARIEKQLQAVEESFKTVMEKSRDC